MTATPMNVNATHNYVFPVTRNYIIDYVRCVCIFIFKTIVHSNHLWSCVDCIYGTPAMMWWNSCVCLTNDQNETENGLLLVNFNA